MSLPISPNDIYVPNTTRKPKIFENVDIAELTAGKCQLFDFDINTEDLEQIDSELSEEREDDAYYGTGVESLQISKSFVELSKEMTSLDSQGLVKKLVLKKGKKEKIVDHNGKLLLNYDLYFDGESKPFDNSRVNERSPQYFSLDNFVTGLAEAIKSMEIGEKSQFLLSWKCAFGKMGCPPMIPPEADILAVIEIIDVVPFSKNPVVLQENISEFLTKVHEVKVLQMEGKKAFQKHNTELSLSKYNKALMIINSASPSSNEERDELKELKITFHLNLAVVHNKQKNAKKALSHCDQALELDLNNQKAIFHRGRAFIQMNEFTKAANELLKGKRLFPENINFGKELLKLEEKQSISISAQLGKAIIK